MLGLVTLLLISGCSQVSQILATPTGLQPTLEAISLMLTQTAAAPTTTVTAIITPSAVPTETVTPTPTAVVGMLDRPGALGQRLQTGLVQLTVLSVEDIEEIAEQNPPEGFQFLQVEVLLQSAGMDPANYFSNQFALIDPDGETYQPAPGLPQGLLRGRLLPGEAVRGAVVFLVPDPGSSEGLDLNGWRLNYAMDSGADAWVRLDQNSGGIPPSGMEVLNRFPDDVPGLNQRVESSGTALVIESAVLEPAAASRKAPAGSAYLIVAARIENTDRTRLSYNPQYFKLRSAPGYEFAAVILPMDEMLHAGSLGRGEQVQGQVVFQVPEDLREALLIYDPLVLTETDQEIRIKLNL